jgi:hypothetical protein
MKTFKILLALFLFSSCIKGKKVDFIFHNTTIHSCDEGNHTYEAVAITDGIITELGPERQILNKYRSESDEDLGAKFIYPTFVDANLKLFEVLIERFSIQTKNTDNQKHLIYLIEKKLEETTIPIITIDSPKFTNEDILQIVNQYFPKQQFYILNQKELIKVKNSNSIIHSEIDKNLILSNLFNSNYNQFSQLYYELENELIEHGFYDVLIHDCSQKEFDFLNRLTKKLKINLHLYIDFFNSTPPKNNIKIAGFYLNERNKASINKMISVKKPLSFSSIFFKENTKLLKSNISTINQDHRWICLVESELNEENIELLNNLNIYPSINFRSNIYLKNNFLACYGSGDSSPFEMELAYIQNKDQNDIQKYKTLFSNSQKLIFQDNKKGSLEKTKHFNMLILRQKLEKINSIEQLYVQRVYIKNKLIYRAD